MLANLFTFLKGILFGVSNLIPGMSGGTMLVITNIYEKLLDAISGIFKKFKSVILFLILFAVGAVIGVLAGAKLINEVALKYATFPTACFFAGVILGSIPFLAKPIIKKTNWKYVISFILGAAVVIGLMFLGLALKSDTEVSLSEITLSFKDYLLLFLSGFIGCFAMLLPGVSGILMLYVFNYYPTFMSALSNLTNFGMENYKNVILVILPVGIGLVLGLIPASKLLNWTFKKFPVGSYFAILGFVLASVAVIFVNVNYAKEGVMTTPQIIIGCVCLPAGFVVSYFLSKMKKNTDKMEEVTEKTRENEEPVKEEAKESPATETNDNASIEEFKKEI